MTSSTEPKAHARLSRGRATGPEEEFLEGYRTLLFGHFRSLDLGATETASRKEAEAIVAKADKAVWEDLYRLETLLIELEPPDALQRHTWILRSEYHELCSADEWQEYQASSPPDGTDARGGVVALRADLAQLQEEIHWHYITLWTFEDFREQVLKRVIGFTLASGAIAAVLQIFAQDYCRQRWGFNLTIAISIVAAGWLGGLISTLRRLHEAKLVGNTDEALTQLESGRMGIAVSPFLGAIFACVLYLLFCSNAFQGMMFPKASIGWLSTQQPTPATLTGQEFAKLLIWSFIAGFLETFVPDNLQRMAASAKK